MASKPSTGSIETLKTFLQLGAIDKELQAICERYAKDAMDEWIADLVAPTPPVHVIGKVTGYDLRQVVKSLSGNADARVFERSCVSSLTSMVDVCLIDRSMGVGIGTWTFSFAQSAAQKLFDASRWDVGRTRLDWHRYNAPVSDTDIVDRFTIEIDQKRFDITAMMDGEPKFVAGPASGRLELEILNPTVQWHELLLSGEHVPYVLPDNNDSTIIGIVTRVNVFPAHGQMVKVVVEMQILEVVA